MCGLRASIACLGSSMQDCHLQEGNRDSGEDRLEKLSTELIHLSSGATFSLKKELCASAENRDENLISACRKPPPQISILPALRILVLLPGKAFATLLV